MNRHILILGAALLWAGAAQAQDKTYSITVTMQDLQVVSAGLDELPRKVSEPVVERLQKQLLPQMQPDLRPTASGDIPPGFERVDGSHIKKVAEPPKAEKK